MRKISVALVVLFFPLIAGAQLGDLMKKATDATSGSLPSLLSQQLGADESQVEGGLGSLFALAKERFQPKDFDKLTSSLPGVESYIDKAKGLGLLREPLKNMAGLKSALGKLGMSPELVSSFVPAAVDLAGRLGGEEVGKLLQSLVSP